MEGLHRGRLENGAYVVARAVAGSQLFPVGRLVELGLMDALVARLSAALEAHAVQASRGGVCNAPRPDYCTLPVVGAISLLLARAGAPGSVPA